MDKNGNFKKKITIALHYQPFIVLVILLKFLKRCKFYSLFEYKNYSSSNLFIFNKNAFIRIYL